MLDLIFTNLNLFKVNVVHDPVVPEDRYHPALTIDYPKIKKIPSFHNDQSYFNFSKANYKSITDFFFSYNWKDTFSQLDINSASITLYDALHFSILHMVSKVNYNKSKFPTWFSKDLINIVFQKRKAHAIFKTTRNPLDYRKFSLLRAKYKFISKQCYRKFIESTETNFCTNPNKFWNFVRKNRSHHDIPKTVNLNGVTSTNCIEVSNLFSKHFSSVYTHPRVLDNSSVSPHLHHDLPSNCFFYVSDVELELSKLRGNKSVGPDGFSGEFLYMLRSSLSYPLWLIFRKSLDEGKYPNLFKISAVTPVLKSRNSSNITNYKPISLSSHIVKLFDLLVLRSIKPVINSILIDEQHGFRSGRSTTTNSLVFSNYIFDAFINRTQVDIIYTDFTKAFNRVDHKLLMRVLIDTGFGEPLLSWFDSYLRDRKQFVNVLGVKSNIIDVPSGVPQGGHLSPLLFALFVNDIKSSLVNCRFLLFADDLKLFLKIQSLKDCLLLQEDLNSLVSWANNRGLELNISKCRSMSFYRTREHINYSYMINDNLLLSAGNVITDLGIVFDRELNFHAHLDKICCKALKTLGFIRRVSSEFKLVSSLKSLYCAFVRSILEYGSVVWDPGTSCGKKQVERVQRKFLNIVAYKLNIDHPPHDYSPVMHRLGLNTLADRRLEANLIFLRRLIDGLVDSSELLAQINFKVPSFHSRQLTIFSLPKCNTNYAKNQPLYRMMSIANKDPTALLYY